MIRPFTLICMLLACASGLYLYQAKHRVMMLDRQIFATVQSTTAARDRAGLLRTEWTLLNDPERLRALSDQYLQLKPLAPGQFTSFAELAIRLPAPRAPEPEAVSEAPIARQEPIRGVDPAPTAAALASGSSSTSSDTLTLAVPRPTIARAVTEAANRPVDRKPAATRMASIQIAATTAPARFQSMPAPAPPAHAMAQVYASQTYPPTPATPRAAIPQMAHGKPVDASLPVMASALGMARTMLPPPVPISAANSALFSHDGN